jgi:uncharacterized membrane protein YfhO
MRDTFYFLKRCGMFCLTENRLFRYSGSTNALDSILGVKYVFNTYERRSGYVKTGISAGGLNLWRNENALPLAYFADDDVLALNDESSSPFDTLGSFLSSLGGESRRYYTPVDVTADYEGCEVEYKDNRILLKTEETGALHFTINNPTRQNVMLYLNSNFSEYTDVYLNGKKLNKQGERLIRSLIDLGELPEGESVVSIYFSDDQHWFSNLCAASFDMQAFRELVYQLKKGVPSALTVSQNQAGKPVVSGTVTAPKNGVIFTSIPADKGWTAEIDGKKVKPAEVGKAFIALPVSKGTHDFRLRYRPSGLTTGVVISGASVILSAFLLVMKLWKRMKTRSRSEVSI